MTFNRMMRLLLGLLGILAGALVAVVAFLTRRMVSPTRQPVNIKPSDLGLPYETVQFPAQDGVRLSGWFIPAALNTSRSGATLIFLHGWGWNRLGDAADDLLADMTGTSPIELLRLAHALHYEGYNLLMFDMRNHGESASQPPVTFGQKEAGDLLGALTFLQGREDVAADQIGVIGFSLGGNALLYALPRTDAIRAAVAVQPTTATVFAERYAHDLLGGVGQYVVLPLTELAYSFASGMNLGALQPTFAAGGAGETPVLFVQSSMMSGVVLKTSTEWSRQRHAVKDLYMWTALTTIMDSNT
ncbi:MAG: alpha/beta fold hydrolase [Chloroflexota bacterium]